MKEKKFIAFFVMLILSFVVSGQIVPPPAPPPPPPGLPLDGGILFLVISGVIYGVKKVRD